MLKMLLVLHIAGGSAALLSMFIPMVAQKGGRVHRRAGWVFVGGMTLVSITALLLSGWRFVFDPRPGVRSGALFLFYIAILTAAGVSTGVRVLRARRVKPVTPPTQVDGAPQRWSWWDVGLSALLLAASVGMVAFGVASGAPLFIAFSLVGFLSGGSQLAYWLRAPTHRMHWWFEHMGSMLGSCIAATTAFLVVNAERLGAADDSLLVWLAPTIIGTPVIAVWTAYYRRRFATSAATRPDTSRSTPAAGPYRRARTS
jgi:uncharacterized membrane protein